MRHAIIAAAAAALAGCAGALDPIPEVETHACPTEAPPAIYKLPPRRTDSVTPDEYAAERNIIDGRHEGFAIEWRQYSETWNECRRPHDASSWADAPKFAAARRVTLVMLDAATLARVVLALR